MNPSARATRWPALGWVVFYAAIAAAWLSLIWSSAGQAGFLVRCLAASDAVGLGSLAAMWALMSVAMMLPTALPALHRFADLVRHRADGSAFHRFLAFLCAYIMIWLGFSLLAASGQRALLYLGLAGPDGRVTDALVAAALLGFAGFYQFSRLKHACLTRCRHPMIFFMANWREGAAGAFRMGLQHGRDCLGCCWALMLLAFVGGTMNLAFMGLALVLMTLEKLAGPGRYVTVPLGLILVSAAGFVLGGAWQAI